MMSSSCTVLPQNRFDLTHQLQWAEWLDEIIVGACIRSSFPVPVLSFGRKHNDIYAIGTLVRLESATYLQAIQCAARHLNVEEYQVREFISCDFQCIVAIVGGQDLVRPDLKRHTDQFS